MLTPEVIRAVRMEVRNYINVIMNSVLGESTTEDQEIEQYVPGAAKMPSRPVAHPYGLCSRAPAGKIGVTARLGDHPGALILLGVRDNNRSNLALQEGEVCLYNEFGQAIYLKDGQIQVGSNTADEPAVLGNVIAEFLDSLLTKLEAGNMFLSTSPGNPTAPNPTIVAELEALRSQYLTTPATNILSQEIYVERGGA